MRGHREWSGTVTVAVKHLKARHTEPKDLLLEFDRRIQRFSEAEDPRTWNPDGTGKPARGKLQSALGAAWAKTTPADEEWVPGRGANDGWRTVDPSRFPWGGNRRPCWHRHQRLTDDAGTAPPTPGPGEGQSLLAGNGRPLRRAQRLC